MWITEYLQLLRLPLRPPPATLLLRLLLLLQAIACGAHRAHRQCTGSMSSLVST
jgi:hypothetical protein